MLQAVLELTGLALSRFWNPCDFSRLQKPEKLVETEVFADTRTDLALNQLGTLQTVPALTGCPDKHVNTSGQDQVKHLTEVA